MFNLVKCDGFKFENVDGYVGYIEYGDFKEYIGFIGYLDVVLVGIGWIYLVYGVEIYDNKIYVCGVEDDKVFIMVVYYGMKILKELGVEFKICIKLILGFDEELGWKCVDYYFNKYL